MAPIPPGRRLPRFAIPNGERDPEAANNRRAAAALRSAGAKVRLEEELRRALRFLVER